MRKLNTTILIGAIVALLGFAIVFGYGKNVDDRVADGQRTTMVLVATEALVAGATPADLAGKLEARAVPNAYLADGALDDLDDVKGMVLLGPMSPGAQVTSAQFGAPTAAGAVRPAKGRVALAVGVSLTPGVARYITPGSRVDVFVTYGSAIEAKGTEDEEARAQAVDGRTKLFASNVKVVSVSIAEPVARDDSEADATNTAAESLGEVVAVLDVTPADAEKLVNAATLGKLYLALSAIDGAGESHKTGGVTAEDVVGSNR